MRQDHRAAVVVGDEDRVVDVGFALYVPMLVAFPSSPEKLEPNACSRPAELATAGAGASATRPSTTARPTGQTNLRLTDPGPSSLESRSPSAAEPNRGDEPR
jgi:hypothetical protein